jgi:molybdenum cofactor cytidylyltransferase
VIGAIVLAAGASTRMGRPKQILPLPGGTVLSIVVSRLLESPVDRVILVLGCEAGAIRQGAGLPDDPRVEVVLNPEWEEGMASSLRRGLLAVPDADAVVVALGDQPGVDPDVVRRLVEERRSGASLVVAVADGRRSHPVLFSHELFSEILALTGDVGAREVVERHWSHAARVPASSLADLDTVQEYEAFRDSGSRGPAPEHG